MYNYDSVNVDTSRATITTVVASDITAIDIIEAPYHYNFTEGLIPLVKRETNKQTGYVLFSSLDGSLYTSSLKSSTHSLCGNLVYDYNNDTDDIDEDGLYVQFEADDIIDISSVSREYLFVGYHTCYISGEFISFQNAEHLGDNEYKFTGVLRGYLGSERLSHVSGEQLWYLGSNVNNVMENKNFIAGSHFEFKAVPIFNNKVYGSISTAETRDVNVSGEYYKPFPVSNLKANDEWNNPTYHHDIVLEWKNRLKDVGAGIGIPSRVMIDNDTAIDGYFRVDVVNEEVVVRSETGIEENTWTYTSTYNISDNGSLADELTFKVYAYNDIRSVRYESVSRDITVRK